MNVVLHTPPQADGKGPDRDLLPDANGKESSPAGQREGAKWQKPRITRKSLMKCCLVKWIIASTATQDPGTGAPRPRGGKRRLCRRRGNTCASAVGGERSQAERRGSRRGDDRSEASNPLDY